MGAEGSGPRIARDAAGRPHDRFPCFDGIRALAALMVIAYHAVFFATWFETPGGRFLWNLNVGVWIFFVTSGFLIYRPFAASHLGDGRPVAWRGYALRRAARIYPAYWAVLAFFTLVVPRASIQGVDGFLLNATLTQTYVRVPNPFLVGLPPAWSLVIEVTFYAVLPFYAAAIARFARRSPPLPVELAGVAGLLGVGVAAIVAVAYRWDPPWITVLPQRLAAFALGMLLAVLDTHRWSPRAVSRLDAVGRPAWAWWALALAVFVAIPLLVRIEPFAAPRPVQTIALNLCQTLVGFFVVVPAVLGRHDAGAIRRMLRSSVLVFLGTVSYGLYLWHWFLLGIVQGEWLGWPLRHGNWVVLLVVGLPVVIAAATASWYLLERPVLRWAHAQRRDERARAEAPRPDASPVMRDA